MRGPTKEMEVGKEAPGGIRTHDLLIMGVCSTSVLQPCSMYLCSLKMIFFQSEGSPPPSQQQQSPSHHRQQTEADRSTESVSPSASSSVTSSTRLAASKSRRKKKVNIPARVEPRFKRSWTRFASTRYGISKSYALLTAFSLNGSL